MTQKRRIGGLLVILVAALALLLWVWRIPASRPSYEDRFSSRIANEWRPLGGAWELSGDSVIDRSDERGAKLLTGSADWTDYELSADVKLLGHDGDVGLIIRSSSEERGVDAYNGYYIGLRAPDSSLITGRADHGWIEARPTHLKSGVHSGLWYHLTVIAKGCTIAAAVFDESTGKQAALATHEDQCADHGDIGLRSMGTGGAWRNVRVEPIRPADWTSILARAGTVQDLIYPVREADYHAMRAALGTDDANRIGPVAVSDEDGIARPLPDAQILPIAGLRSKAEDAGESTIRGVVTLTDPIYIQDSSAGIAVHAPDAMLNIGDEVEFVGHLGDGGTFPWFQASAVHLLWGRNPLVPVSVTSTQAASGEFEAALVDVRGILREKHIQSDGAITLQMTDSSQSFRAVMQGGLAAQAFRSWIPGSELRLRGICTMNIPGDHGGTQSADDSFNILLRSVDDVEVIQDPPFWNSQRIFQAILAAVGLTVVLALIYVRFERVKARAVLEERERLAHDMHDTLAQSFAGVGFHLQGVRNGFKSGRSDIESVMRKIDVACELVTASHREASATIAALHPEADGDLDLLVALERCIRTMVEDDFLPVTMERHGPVRSMSLSTRDLLFHVGREAMTNVLRHSRSTSATLALRYQPQRVSLTISDNGSGFDATLKSAGFGIRTMHRRCEKLDASLEISSHPGKGSAVTVHAPYGLRKGIRERLRSLTQRVIGRPSRMGARS